MIRRLRCSVLNPGFLDNLHFFIIEVFQNSTSRYTSLHIAIPSDGSLASSDHSNLQLSQNKRQSTGVTCFQSKAMTIAGKHMLPCLRCRE